ncbi:poly-gamma-glutamate biosynthesis protein PgsC [uncultured Fusobacterium sp.]|uniref:poly-gamma-glutamate biosynthesis protein PgsC n=1 Tax=uncultured Fusobacterium sp. TaxID=159267 RepID=UPI0025F63166|nr:poly-gamma-glutamate biosynthesis protein PgsC [uncultured Fusobacterium sp.]
MSSDIIVFGIILSILFYEFTEISPGGLIVPAYISFYINTPNKVILTLIVSFITYLIVLWLSNKIIIYGRRKFAIYIIITFIVKEIFSLISPVALEYNMFLLSGNIIGILIPALIARDIERNGTIKTFCSLIILSIFIKSIIELYYQIGGIL